MYKKISMDNEINFEKLLLTNLVIYFQFSLLLWMFFYLTKKKQVKIKIKNTKKILLGSILASTRVRKKLLSAFLRSF